MSLRLEGKVVIVTGAGSGLGEASATLFAQQGAAVGCVDLFADAAERVAESIRASGGRAVAVAADVSSAADAERMVAATVEAFGSLDGVYANAGIPGSGAAGDITTDDWDRVIAVNLTGVWLTSKFVLPHLLAKGGGSIVNQASVGGLVGVPGIASYAAAKAGVIGLTRQMAVEYAPKGIRVNAVCPGTVPTPLVRRTYEQAGGFAAAAEAAGERDVDALLEKARMRFPIGRLGTPLDIAHAALFLLSDDSAWITGIALPVDGGMTAQ
jgi:NAD(P)-dependent dehydrogenase (short-subunit alcohol dehydrogenase family)